ncbi:MAG: hypothetical protein H6757_02170 [Candidatus Omnitrophica bacterium]|nr:hypothetical protein [Candidatus Omnitrophota bacterium]
MKNDIRKFRTKEKKFLQLYSLWQETRRCEIQRRCLGLLGEIIRMKPQFSLRREFEVAF